MRDTQHLADALEALNLPAGPLEMTQHLWATGPTPRHRLHATSWCGGSNNNKTQVEVRFDDPRQPCSRCGGQKFSNAARVWVDAITTAHMTHQTVLSLERGADRATLATLERLQGERLRLRRLLDSRAEAVRRVANGMGDTFGYRACSVAFDDCVESLRVRLDRGITQVRGQAARWCQDNQHLLAELLALDLACGETVAHVEQDWSERYGNALVSALCSAAAAYAQGGGGSGVSAGDALDAAIPDGGVDLGRAKAALLQHLTDVDAPTTRDEYPGAWLTRAKTGENPFDRIEREWDRRRRAAAGELLEALDRSRQRFLAPSPDEVVLLVGQQPRHRGGVLLAPERVLARDVASGVPRLVARVSATGAVWLHAWADRYPTRHVVDLSPARQPAGDGGERDLTPEVAHTFLSLWSAYDFRWPIQLDGPEMNTIHEKLVLAFAVSC